MKKSYKPHDKTAPPEYRFWVRVEKTRRCWWWKPTKKSNTRGIFCAAGHRYQSSVYSWILHNGPIRNGLYVLHTCDNPACVRPDHLFLGTQKENLQDCLKKGRFNHGSRGSRGELHPLARLSESDVREIRRRYVKGTGRYNRGNSLQLSREYGVCTAEILQIAKGIRWSHLK